MHLKAFENLKKAQKLLLFYMNLHQRRDSVNLFLTFFDTSMQWILMQRVPNESFKLIAHFFKKIVSTALKMYAKKLHYIFMEEG